MLVLIESCLNTECIAVCCAWDYIAVNQFGLPLLTPVHHRSTNNVYMSIRTGFFQQENSPCHKAKVVHEYFDEHIDFDV